MSKTRNPKFSMKRVIILTITLSLLSPAAVLTSALPCFDDGMGGGWCPSPPPPDTTKPNVSITSPSNGATISGTVTIAASASDSGSGMHRVKFYIGSTYLGQDYSSPYSRSLHTHIFSDGSYTLKARAYDNAGNYRDSTIIVTIDNVPESDFGVNLDIRTGIYGDYGYPYRYTSLDGLRLQITNNAHDVSNFDSLIDTGLYTYQFTSESTSVQLSISVTFIHSDNAENPFTSTTITVYPNQIQSLVLTPTADEYIFKDGEFIESDWNVYDGTYIIKSDYSEFSTTASSVGVTTTLTLTVNSLIYEEGGSIVEIDFSVSTTYAIEILWWDSNVVFDPYYEQFIGNIQSINIRGDTNVHNSNSIQMSWEMIGGYDYRSTASAIHASSTPSNSEYNTNSFVLNSLSLAFSTAALLVPPLGIPFSIAGLVAAVGSTIYAGAGQGEDKLKDSVDNGGVAFAEFSRDDASGTHKSTHITRQGNIVNDVIHYISTYNSFEIRKAVNDPVDTFSITAELFGFMWADNSQSGNYMLDTISVDVTV